MENYLNFHELPAIAEEPLAYSSKSSWATTFDRSAKGRARACAQPARLEESAGTIRCGCWLRILGGPPQGVRATWTYSRRSGETAERSNGAELFPITLLSSRPTDRRATKGKTRFPGWGKSR